MMQTKSILSMESLPIAEYVAISTLETVLAKLRIFDSSSIRDIVKENKSNRNIQILCREVACKAMKDIQEALTCSHFPVAMSPSTASSMLKNINIVFRNHGTLTVNEDLIYLLARACFLYIPLNDLPLFVTVLCNKILSVMGYVYVCPKCGVRQRQKEVSIEHNVTHEEAAIGFESLGFSGRLADFSAYSRKIELSEFLTSRTVEVDGRSPIYQKSFGGFCSRNQNLVADSKRESILPEAGNGVNHSKEHKNFFTRKDCLCCLIETSATTNQERIILEDHIRLVIQEHFKFDEN